MSTFMSGVRGKLLSFGGGFLLLMATGVTQANSVTYVYTDPQGTPLAEADVNGNITATFDYAPYGSIALGTAPNGPGYTGHVNDPDTQLVYMQARYYDPSVGRFLSEDPVRPAAGNLFNFNRYGYANNNPVLNTDPTGKCTGSLFASCPGGGSIAGPGSTTYVGTPSRAQEKIIAQEQRAQQQSPKMTSSGKVAGAVLTLLGGTAAEETKRSNNQTKLPDKLAHELFMLNAGGVGVAALPGAITVGTAASPVLAEGAVPVIRTYGARAAFYTCVAMNCMNREEDIGALADDLERMEQMAEESKILQSEMYKMIQPTGGGH